VIGEKKEKEGKKELSRNFSGYRKKSLPINNLSLNSRTPQRWVN
jgi:hypothetical protein